MTPHTAVPRAAPRTPERSRIARWSLAGLLLAIAAASVASLLVGAGDLAASASGDAPDYFWISRVPRTVSLILAGASLALAGMIMQLIARNRFVEPSTAGTVDSAALGVVLVMILAPGLPVIGKLLVGMLAALAGTALFMIILRRIPLRDPLVVPLIGIMLGGVIGAASTFLAYRFNLMQSLAALQQANFGGVLQGRYELLWLVAVLAAVAFIAADRFTVAGLGDSFATNLGLNYGRVVALALVIVSITVATVVVHVGAIPFIGLVVPNIVAIVLGDNVRRTAPWVAALGALAVLASDLLGRIIRYPFELPAGLVLSVAGAAIFLVVLLRPQRRKGVRGARNGG